MDRSPKKVDRRMGEAFVKVESIGNNYHTPQNLAAQLSEGTYLSLEGCHRVQKHPLQKAYMPRVDDVFNKILWYLSIFGHF